MTDQEMRIAIAEHRGWKYRSVGEYWISPEGDDDHPPDFPNDLNAMHEAEKKDCEHAFGPNALPYEAELRKICRPNPVWHATARQRAEAFLKTIGKWR